MPVTRFAADGPPQGMQPTQFVPPEAVVEGPAEERGHIYFNDATGQITAGVWECTDSVTEIESFPFDEMIVVLQGKAEITDETGVTHVLEAGACATIAKGSRIRWRVSGNYKEYFLIYGPPH